MGDCGAVSVRRILEEIQNVTGIEIGMMRSQRRLPEAVVARHMAYWLCRQMTGLSYQQIGNLLNRDHSTILTGCQAHSRRMSHDRSLQARTIDIFRRLGGKSAPATTGSFLPEGKLPPQTVSFYSFVRMAKHLGYEVVIRPDRQGDQT